MSNILSIRLREEDKLLREFFSGVKQKDKSFWARLLMEEALRAREGGIDFRNDFPCQIEKTEDIGHSIDPDVVLDDILC